jgi:hypothetical protein
VLFAVVHAACGVAIVVSGAAISGVREELVLLVVVTDPVAAALGAVHLAGLAAQPAGILRHQLSTFFGFAVARAIIVVLLDRGRLTQGQPMAHLDGISKVGTTRSTA